MRLTGKVHGHAIPTRYLIRLAAVVLLLIPIIVIVSLYQQSGAYRSESEQFELESLNFSAKANNLESELDLTQAELASVSAAYEDLAAQDQYLINQALEATIKSIEDTYPEAVEVYEDLLKYKELKPKDTSKLDEAFVKSLSLLADRNYATAASVLAQLKKDIASEQNKLTASFQIPANTPVSNTPPGSGYARQQVETSIGSYLVSLVSADLGSTKVIVDTASASDCDNDCPVLPLHDYVSRSGAFAGINGPYFCPASYPSCAGKTNSFDMLIMNKDKHYFNSDQNVYSTVPAVIFSGSSARFVGQSLEWGRDTGVDAVIANHPRIVSGGNVAFNGDGDPKKGSKSGRGFIGATGSTVYIGVVHNATVAEAAHAVASLGIQDAINLDGGGSTALWSGGYKVGPGRSLPFGILFVRK